MRTRFLCGINGALAGVVMHRYERKTAMDRTIANEPSARGVDEAASSRSRFRDQRDRGVTS
jgi:hypothetical protein